MSQNNFILVFNSIENQLPIQFQMSSKISPNIIQKLIFDKDHKYQVQSKVSEEVFQQFFQYLIDGIEPEIHFDTIYEFKQLSQEFEIQELKLNIENKKNQWRSIEQFFQQQSTINSTATTSDISSVNQQLEQIHTIHRAQSQQIDKLTNKNIVYDSINKENETKINILNQQLQQITNENQQRESNIDNNFNRIDNEIQPIKEQIDIQNSTIQDQHNQIEELKNQIEILKNHIETINNQITMQQNNFDVHERDVNAKLETIQIQLEKYISKDI